MPARPRSLSCRVALESILCIRAARAILASRNVLKHMRKLASGVRPLPSPFSSPATGSTVPQGLLYFGCFSKVRCTQLR